MFLNTRSEAAIQDELEKSATIEVNSPMTVKSAAFLALIGVALATIVLVLRFIQDVLAFSVIPPVSVLASLLFAFAGITAVVFLYAIYKAQR